MVSILFISLPVFIYISASNWKNEIVHCCKSTDYVDHEKIELSLKLSIIKIVAYRYRWNVCIESIDYN